MVNISPAEILQILGKWTKSSEFICGVAERLKISQRYAYMLVKKDKQILKLVLDDRTVLYGLAEFGKPSQNGEIVEEIVEQIDIRPEFGGVKASPRFCEKHNLPQFREVKHTIYKKG
jgi:hypothetical protein